MKGRVSLSNSKKVNQKGKDENIKKDNRSSGNAENEAAVKENTCGCDECQLSLIHI